LDWGEPLRFRGKTLPPNDKEHDIAPLPFGEKGPAKGFTRRLPEADRME
jgi:hypothetical protein